MDYDNLSKPKKSNYCSIFNGLPEAILSEFENVKIQKYYNKGQTIQLQGTPIFGMSYIESGMVKKVKSLDNGDDTIITLCEKGDFFGFHSVLSSSISVATHSVIALEKTIINFYDKTFVLGLLKKNPQIGINIITKYLESFERDALRILSLSKKTVRERVAEMIISLSSKYCEFDGENITGLSFKLTRMELSLLSGTANETLIRTLADFQREGMIKLLFGDIFVTDIQELKYISGAAV